MTSLRPIKKRSAEAEAAEALRNHVIGGGARPGERLTEIRLSEALGLSRTTVRTALHQLANEGLVVQVPYTGWAVTSLTSADAWELYTLRGSMEALAARLLTETLDSDKEAQLQQALESLAAACQKGDEVAIVDRDLALHKLVVELSGHRRLMDQYRLIEQHIRLYLIWSDRLMRSHADIIETHRPIVDAIVTGNAKRAESILRDHNESAGRVLVEFFNKAVQSPAKLPDRPIRRRLTRLRSD
jgi:DNA-binding GntR family transcriptional regulator